MVLEYAVGIAFLLVFLWYFSIPRTARAIIAAAHEALAERICPACGYRFGVIEAEDDGCTICPECSAAWRMKAFVDKETSNEC